VNGPSMVDPAWQPPAGIWVNPVDGWGYMETIDGKLAPMFSARIDAAGVDSGGGIKGWRGSVASSPHKYAGMELMMRPRHTHWSGVVVAEITQAGATIFNGMANTSGLECDWL
jgi:hypothetical protein